MFDEDYFKEEYEAQETISDIVEIAKGLVKNEVKKKLETQEKRIQIMEDELKTYRNFAEEKYKLEQEINRLTYENRFKYDKGYNDAKRERLLKLFDLQRGYAVGYKYDYIKPKCDKCDDRRQIHFKSPSGKDCKEDCECAKMSIHFYVSETMVDSFVLENNRGGSIDTPSRYYRRAECYSKGEPVEFDSWGQNRIWVYENYSDVDKLISEKYINSSDVVFESKDDAEKYINWLNENYLKILEKRK